MSVVIKIINFINTRALKRQFAQFLEEIECQYSGILTYNVRWLSFGLHRLKRFVTLLEEIKLFLIEKDNSFDELSNIHWLNNLMFLCDLTQHFNELNKKRQGHGLIILTMFENIKIFMTKLDMFTKDLEKKIMKYFPQLQKHFQNTIIFANSVDNQENAIKNI